MRWLCVHLCISNKKHLTVLAVSLLLGYADLAHAQLGDLGSLLKPGFHVSPAYGWGNDPNGLFVSPLDGSMHLFFQAGCRLSASTRTRTHTAALWTSLLLLCC